LHSGRQAVFKLKEKRAREEAGGVGDARGSLYAWGKDGSPTRRGPYDATTTQLPLRPLPGAARIGNGM